MTTNMTDEDATRIGQAIAKAAKMIALPIDNSRECRAIALKLAIETRNVAFAVVKDGAEESAAQVVTAAELYLSFIKGGDPR